MTNLEKLRDWIERADAADGFLWPAVWVEDLRSVLAELEAGQKLREVVVELEWSSNYFEGKDREPIECCPMCGVAEEIGVHGQGCVLWDALAALAKRDANV